jgi:hypothetical protein
MKLKKKKSRKYMSLWERRASRVPEFLGHSLRNAHGGDPAGLRAADLAAGGVAGLGEVLRDLGRLPGARLADHDEHLVVVDRIDQLVLQLEDRQALSLLLRRVSIIASLLSGAFIINKKNSSCWAMIAYSDGLGLRGADAGVAEVLLPGGRLGGRMTDEGADLAREAARAGLWSWVLPGLREVLRHGVQYRLRGRQPR